MHNATFSVVTTRRFVTLRRNTGDRETDALTLIIQIQRKWQLFRLSLRRYIYPVHKLVILAQSHVFQVPCPSWYAASLRLNTVTCRHWGSLWTQAQVMQYQGHNRQGVVLWLKGMLWGTGAENPLPQKRSMLQGVRRRLGKKMGSWKRSTKERGFAREYFFKHEQINFIGFMFMTQRRTTLQVVQPTSNRCLQRTGQKLQTSVTIHSSNCTTKVCVVT